MEQNKLTAAEVAHCYQIYVQYLKHHKLKDDSDKISPSDVVTFVNDQIDEEERQQLYESYHQDISIFNNHVKGVFDGRIAIHEHKKGD